MSSPASSDITSDKEIVNKARLDRNGLFNQSRLLNALEHSSLDAVVALTIENVTYTGGAHIEIPIFFSFIVTTADGSQGAVINEADAYYFREHSWLTDMRTFTFTTKSATDASAFTLLAELLTDLGLTESRVGIEIAAVPWTYFEQLRKAMPNVDWQNASDVFDYAREVKTPDEVALYRVAAFLTDKAIQTGFAMGYPEQTEKALAADMQTNVLQLGADSLSHAHVHSGAHSTIVHAISIERPCHNGEVIHVDFGGSFAGYQTDISRNAVVGGPTLRQADIYKRLWEVEQELFSFVRPGVIAEEVFQFSETAFAKVDLVYPWGQIGHSIGLGVHESPELALGAKTALEPGMILQIEPSHIESGDARYHIEDAILITESGIELLSYFSDTREMFVIR